MINQFTKTILIMSVFAVVSIFTFNARVLGYGTTATTTATTTPVVTTPVVTTPVPNISSVSNGGGGGVVFYGGGSSFGYNFAPVQVNLSGSTNGKVLGESTCAPHFIKYNRIGKLNDRNEVLKLQNFLNTYEGENINNTGYFGPVTFAAVKRFQSKYSVNPVSGHQLVLTTNKLNEIYCSKVSQ